MHCKIFSAICFNLDQSKILLSGNGLREENFIRCSIFFTSIAMANRTLTGIKFFQEISKEDQDRTKSVKFDNNWIGSFRDEVTHRI